MTRLATLVQVLELLLNHGVIANKMMKNTEARVMRTRAVAIQPEERREDECL